MSAPLLLTWLAGTLLPLGALWLVYRLALRGERCFGYNRAFLLLAPVLAAILPLLPRPALPLWLNSPTVAVAASKTGVAVLLPAGQISQAPTVAEWSVWTWLGAIYLAGVALGLGRLAWQAGRLWALARRLPGQQRPGYVLAHTGGRLPTSSFGRVVFWDETAGLPLADELVVLAHEVAHVRQRHTLDVLWLEAWRAVLWPNPFAHLLLPGLRLTHELLADAAASSAMDTAAYPTLLARLATQRLSGPAYSSLLQPFTFSFTLTRIAMLQNQNPVRHWKQWLVLPALGGLFFLGSHAALAQGGPEPSEAQQKARQDDVNRKTRLAEREDSIRTGGKFEPGTTQQVNITYGENPGEDVVTVTRVPIPSAPPQPATSNNGQKVYTYVEQMPQLPGGGGQAAIVKTIRQNVEYPKSMTKGNTPKGRVFAQFLVNTKGEVQETKIVKGLNPALDDAILASIKQLPRFEPGRQNNKPVSVTFTVPIEFQ